MAALVLLAGSAVPALANGAPRPRPEIQFGERETKVVVEVDEKAKQPRLVIPAQLLAPVKGPGQPGAGAALPTIVVGLALTLSFVTGGFWLLRKGPGRSLVMLFVLSLALVGVTTVQADLARPPETKPVKLPADVMLTQDKITLEVTPFGNTVKLIVPKDAAKTAAKAEPEEKKPE